MNFRLLLAGLVGLVLTACAHVEPEKAGERSLILVSIDGFRADYLDRGVTPVLSQLARDGVRAAAMRPSFPSVTFPNHYTIVTGLRPDHHGIVNNYMEDAGIPGKTFKLSDREVLADPRWWNAGEPIWVSAEKAGVRTATMFWPGSETEIRNVRPQDWTPYDKALPYAERVDRLLGWLDRPRETRPRFMTLYFESVDTQGHIAGPDSAEVNAALADVDAAMGRLVAGLRARGTDGAADIVVVSDHGMAATSSARVFDLDTLIDPKFVRFGWLSRAFVGLDAFPQQKEAVERALLKRHDHFSCWRKNEMPARFHFGTNARIPAIFCLADAGWSIVSGSRPDGYKDTGGAHGYDPDAPEMAGLFIANGRSFRQGSTLPAFDNVDVYPLMARLLGIEPAANDGDARTFDGVLVR